MEGEMDNKNKEISRDIAEIYNRDAQAFDARAFAEQSSNLITWRFKKSFQERVS